MEIALDEAREHLSKRKKRSEVVAAMLERLPAPDTIPVANRPDTLEPARRWAARVRRVVIDNMPSKPEATVRFKTALHYGLHAHMSGRGWPRAVKFKMARFIIDGEPIDAPREYRAATTPIATTR